MSSVSTFSIDASEWPSREDLSEFTHQANAKEEVQQFLTQEFDTLISFRIGELDLLAGYPEAFFLPLHAFVRSLSAVLKATDLGDSIEVPIYLQQYAVAEGDPAHKMRFRPEKGQIVIELEWGGESVPSALADFQSVSVERKLFRKEVARFIDFYTKKIVLLLGPLSGWSEEQIGQLFSDF